MWSRIKSAFGWLAGAVIGILMLLLKLKNRKIERQKEDIADLKSDVKVKDVELRTTVTAKTVEAENAEKQVEIKEQAQSTIDDYNAGNVDYNRIIEGWNDEKSI